MVSSTKPLSHIKDGEKVKFVSVDAGRGLKNLLAAMGLVPNTEFAVIRNTSHGPMILNVKSSRLALGRTMASRIMVTKCLHHTHLAKGA